MALVKLTNYSFVTVNNKIVLQAELEAALSIFPGGTPSVNIFKSIYLDNLETWTIADKHDPSDVENNFLWYQSTLVPPMAPVTKGNYAYFTVNIPIGSDTPIQTSATTTSTWTAKFSQEDFLILSINLDGNNLAPAILGSSSCSDYCIKFPIYNLLKLRLSVLESARKIVMCCNGCELPKCFIHKVLMIDSIELFAKCGYLYRAAEAFAKLRGKKINKEKVSTTSNCGCNGI